MSEASAAERAEKVKDLGNTILGWLDIQEKSNRAVGNSFLDAVYLRKALREVPAGEVPPEVTEAVENAYFGISSTTEPKEHSKLAESLVSTGNQWLMMAENRSAG